MLAIKDAGISRDVFAGYEGTGYSWQAIFCRLFSFAMKDLQLCIQ